MYNLNTFKYFLKLYFLSIAIFTILRIVFLCFNLEGNIGLLYLFKILLIGFIIDSCCISFLILTIYLFLLIPSFFNFNSKLVNKIFAIAFISMLSIFIFINIADIFYYQSYGIRLNYLAVEIFKNFKIVGPMLWKSYPVVCIVISFVILIFILSSLVFKIRKNTYHKNSINRWYFILIIIITFLTSSFIYIGPPFWYYSSMSENPAINQASLNGVYTLIKSIQQQSIYERDIPQHEYFAIENSVTEFN